MYQINFNSAIPIYVQIERQAQFLIASGAFPEGQTIPSIREAAKEMTINPQTVVKAYSELRLMGLIQSVRGLGYVVCPGARVRCQRVRNVLFQERVEETITELALGRLSPDEMRKLVEAALDKVITKFYNIKRNYRHD